ncbi:MAG: CvpA family protein [Desulfopila sp.]
MTGGGGITIYDMVVIGIFSLLIARGVWLGFLRQITGLVALYIGYIAAGQYHDKFFPFLRELSDSPEVVFLASYALMFIATFLVVSLVGKLLANAVHVSIVGWFDRILGGILGCAKGGIIVVLLHMVLGVMLPPESKLIRTCQSCATLDKAVETTRQMIASDDVRQAFRQRQSAISLDAVKDALAPLSTAVGNSPEGKAAAGVAGTGNREKK